MILEAIWPALCVVYAALCVWLTVRIANRRERWAKRTAAVMAIVPALYVASFGPACWISSRTNFGEATISAVYQPLTWASSNSTRTSSVLCWYAEIGAAAGFHWGLLPFVKPQGHGTVSIGYSCGWGKLDSPTP